LAKEKHNKKKPHGNIIPKTHNQQTTTKIMPPKDGSQLHLTLLPSGKQMA
jgi:hypothetical protein